MIWLQQQLALFGCHFFTAARSRQIRPYLCLYDRQTLLLFIIFISAEFKVHRSLPFSFFLDLRSDVFINFDSAMLY